MSSRHNQFLKRARTQALKTIDLRRQFGCVIVDANKIMAEGHNRKSHPKTPTISLQNGEFKYFGLHTEIDALLKCDFSVRGFSIYIHGQNRKTKNTVYSGPCQLCQTVLKERGIKKAIFSTPSGIKEILISGERS